MSCNPCCCWKLKDAAVSIGIWSAIFAIASFAMYGWQWGVLAQCSHVTMAQSNLQCEYYCPCVGASTARTSALIEGLFVVQILCLIVAFFLLFASVFLIYGVHTWSRALLWPWLICMCCSILTSLAYCITWWAGDVRDYWLVLTILQFFGVIINCYCFVVIWVFYKNMADELRYYEGRRGNKKYNRFNRHGTPQTTIEPDVEEDDFGVPEPYPNNQFQNWDDRRWPPFDPNIKYPSDLQPAPYRPPYDRGKMPHERFDNFPIDDPIFDDSFEQNQGRLQPAQSMPTLFDDFRDVPRQHHRESLRRKHCSRCEHRHHRNHSHCHHHRHHSRRHSRRKKADNYSSTCSTDLTTEDETVSTNPQGGRRRHRSHHDHRPSHRRSESKSKRRNRLSDDELTLDLALDRLKPKSTRSAVIQVDPNELTPTAQNAQTFPPTNGISIPQHIIIPPETDADGGQPKKYHINSEITISYDPRAQAVSGTSPIRPDSRQQFGSTTPAPTSSRLPPLNPISITSNV